MHVLITGAADGIGESLTNLFSKEVGVKLSLLDINKEKATMVANTLKCEAAVFEVDLSKPEVVNNIVERVVRKNGEVDVLVNNAGVMSVNNFHTESWERGELMLNLNMVTPMKLIHRLVPTMVKNRGGHIINISSMAALTPIPGCGFYSASKAGFAIASEIIRSELKDETVKVLTVYPGPIATGLEKGARAGYKQSLISDLLPVGNKEKIAEKIFRAYKNNDERLIYPASYELARHIPALTYFVTENFAPKPVV